MSTYRRRRSRVDEALCTDATNNQMLFCRVTLVDGNGRALESGEGLVATTGSLLAITYKVNKNLGEQGVRIADVYYAVAIIQTFIIGLYHLYVWFR